MAVMAHCTASCSRTPDTFHLDRRILFSSSLLVAVMAVMTVMAEQLNGVSTIRTKAT